MQILTDDRRKLEQIPVLDEDGRIEYYKIPNYTLRKEFLTATERKFLRILINIIKKLNEDKEKNIYLQVSTQVAINRIIDINNKRNSALYEEIRDKSIDYVLFDINSGNIITCIELDDNSHITDEKRIKRDKLLDKMFNEIAPIIHIKPANEYNETKILNEIKRYIKK